MAAGTGPAQSSDQELTVWTLPEEHRFAILLSEQQNLQEDRGEIVRKFASAQSCQIRVSFTFVSTSNSQIALVTDAILKWKLCPRGFVGVWSSLQTRFAFLFCVHFGRPCIKPTAVLTILPAGHLIRNESFCSWKVVYLCFVSLHNKHL